MCVICWPRSLPTMRTAGTKWRARTGSMLCWCLSLHEARRTKSVQGKAKATPRGKSRARNRRACITANSASIWTSNALPKIFFHTRLALIFFFFFFFFLFIFFLLLLTHCFFSSSFSLSLSLSLFLSFFFFFFFLNGQILAILRGEELKELSVKVTLRDFASKQLEQKLAQRWTSKVHARHRSLMSESVQAALTRLLCPRQERAER